MHLICPPKVCITFVFHFSWVLQLSQEKLKTMLMQNFGRQIRCIVGNVEVACRRLSVVLDAAYNFYLRHIVWLEMSQKRTTPYPFFLWLRTPIECEQKKRSNSNSLTLSNANSSSLVPMCSISKAISLNYGKEIIAMLWNVACSKKTFRFWDEEERENESEFPNAK